MSAGEQIHFEFHASPVSGPLESGSVDPAGRLNLLEIFEWVRPAKDPIHYVLVLDGAPVPLERWKHLIPRAGSRITIIYRPGAEVVAGIVAFFVALGSATASVVTLGFVGTTTTIAAGGVVAGVGSAVGVAIGTAALSFGLQTLAGALINPAQQDLVGPDGGGKRSPTFTGSGNAIRKREPFPYVAGDFRFQPPLGAFTFSLVRGSETILSALFIIGLEEHAIDAADIMVGDIAFTSFARGELAIRTGALTDPPLTIFTDRVLQMALNNVFDPIRHDDVTLMSAYSQIRVPGEGHTKLGFDLNIPTGISRVSSQSADGQLYLFGIQVEYRKNSGTWTDATTGTGIAVSQSGTVEFFNFNGIQLLRFRGNRTRPIQLGFEFNVVGDADDVYDIRMRRIETQGRGGLLGANGGTVIVVGTVQWFAVKGFNYNLPPLDVTGIATIEIRIPLDEQFSGLQNNFSARPRRKVRIYNPAAVGGADADGWSTLKFESSNPAAIIRNILQGKNNRRPLADSRLDIQSFTDFYNYCEAFNDGGSGKLRFDFVFESRQKMIDTCQTVAAGGRGRFQQDGQGRFSVVFDGPKTTAVGILQAANLRNMKQEISFPQQVHAIRALFVDRNSGFDPDGELIVYADGYSGTGAGGTTVADESTFQTLELPGTTEAKLAYALARYFLATLLLRRRQIEQEMGLEHLHYKPGQLVLASHPALLLGQAWGRVRSSSAAVYRDPFQGELAPYAENIKTLDQATGTYGDLTGPVAFGDGALEMVTLNTSLAKVVQLFSTGYNWTGMRVDVHARAGVLASLGASDGIRIRACGPTTADFKEYRFGTGSGLNASTLTSIGFAFTDSPTATGGSFNVASVIQLEVHVNAVGAAAGLHFRLNNLRVSRVDGAFAELDLTTDVLLTPGKTYAIDHRRARNSPPRNEMNTLVLRTLGSFGVTSQRRTNWVYLSTAISDGSQPVEGDLVAFGESGFVSGRFIIKEKTPGPGMTARVLLVDEAPGVHNATGVLPAFAPTTSLPVPLNQIGPDQPTIRELIADERALVKSGDGTLKPRILVQVIPGTARGRPSADFYSVRYRRLGDSSLGFLQVPRVGATASEIVIDDVDQGVEYEVIVQGVTGGERPGLISREARQTIFVTGTLNRPPDVKAFRVEGTLLRWQLDTAPLDLAGFRITRTGTTGTYDQSVSIHGPMLVSAPPFDLSLVDPGNGKLFIVAVDVVGNESLNPQVYTGFIGAIPAKNIVTTVDVKAAGFPMIDLVDEVLNGFEDLTSKETPNTSLTIPDLPGVVSNIASIVGSTGTILDLERTSPMSELQSLKVIDADSSGCFYTITYSSSINREDSLLKAKFRGTKVATWAVSLKVIEFGAPTKWTRYDFTGLAGNTDHNLSATMSAAGAANGAGGAVNDQMVGAIEVTITNSAAAVNDTARFDDIQWVGGAVQGVEVTGGNLVTRDIGANPFWRTPGTTPFWKVLDTAPFWNASSFITTGTYRFSVTPGSTDVPSDLRISITVSASTSYRIQYQLASGDFADFPGTIPITSTSPIIFQILLDGGTGQAQITALSVILDTPDQSESVVGFSVASTGTVRIPITKTYRSIIDIFATPQGSTPITVLVLDKNSTSGPSVQTVNAAGTRVVATVDFFVRGVKG